ncbi:hypothetical protein MMC10_007595 [Thelotrema lepadinum]|nr:hypothetical protein [Thelotrema lepadinum]
MHLAWIITACAGLALPALSAPAACSSGTIIKDGGFESGVTPPTSGGPWTVYAFIGASSYGLSSPGSTNKGGKYAFEASCFPGPYSSGNSGDTLNQTLKTCAGQNYSITADYKFNQTANNNCAIAIQYPYKTGIGSVITGSGTAGVSAGVWYTTGGLFQAVSAASTLSIVFSCSNNADNYIYVDNVKVAPYAGNAY